MPNPHFIGKYNDPVFHQIKTSFNNRSDDFPVLMLPVRLETRFMTYSRVIRPSDPSKVDVNVLVQALYRIAFDVKVFFDLPEDKSSREWIVFKSPSGISKAKAHLDKLRAELQKVDTKLKKLETLTRLEKTILKDAVSDLSHEANQISDLSSYGQEGQAFLTLINEIGIAVNKVKAPSIKIPNYGKKYLDALNKLQESIEKIFVIKKVNAKSLDAELDAIEKQIDEIEKLANTPDFSATEKQIKQIESQISYIKRKHKSSDGNLQGFKNGYTGSRDLKAKELELKKQINLLQKKIKEEHKPVLEANQHIKKYPVQQLHALINKGLSFVSAANRKGTTSSSVYHKYQQTIAGQLKSIEAKSKIPLDGTVAEINAMKSSYGKLKSQLENFQKGSDRVKALNALQTKTISKSNATITSQMKALKELEPGVIKVNTQILGNETIRRSAIRAFDTRTIMLGGARTVTKPQADPKKQLEIVQKELEAVQQKIKISVANTTLIPRKEFNKIKSAFFSLKDQVNNVIEANPLPESNQTKEQTDLILNQIENQILDQLVDVNDPRDRFYKEYRDRIVFVPRSEVVNELWVRVYPDDIAIDNHDERITLEEEQIAKDFYHEVYSKAAKDRASIKIAAWRAAATSLGVRRGAYILKAMEPREVKQGRVETYVNELDKFLRESLRFGEKNARRIKAEEWLATNEELFASAKKPLVKILDKGGFTPCQETKSTLDFALEQLKLKLSQLEELSQKLNRARESARVENLAAMINDIGRLIHAYYKTHLDVLNTPFRPKLTFPSIDKKEKSWDKGATSDALPDRFVFVTKRANQYQHIVVGKTISRPLPVGLDPLDSENGAFQHLPNGDLQVPDTIKWMFDFDAAVDAGMGVKIPLDGDDMRTGFDLVMAYGVQDGEASVGQEKINALFNGHLYSDGGLEYLPVGTATNNTEEVKSPYKALDNDLDGAYDVFFGDEPPVYLNSSSSQDELKITDGQFFKEALGLPESIANFMRNHDKKDICNGRAMNRSLYNATLKYFFKVMTPNLISHKTAMETMLFMLHYVSAVGTLPAFRVDNQPYGVLPVSPIKQFKVTEPIQKGSSKSFIKDLTLFLKQTKVVFDSMREPVSVHSDAYEADPQAEFMKVLGLEPYSKEFFFRFGVNAANRWQNPNEEQAAFEVNWDHSEGDYSPKKVANNYNFLLKEAGFVKTEEQESAVNDSNIYKNRFSEGNYILGNLVQDPRLSSEALETTDKGQNYISWLIQNSSRQSLVDLTYSDLPKVNVDGEEQVQYTVLLAMLRGALVYDNSSFALDAMKVLENLDVPTLEKMLSSHIDLVSYRLDAWLSGLSDYRLKELREAQQTGTYLGAYGFVHDLRPVEMEAEEVNRLPAGLESSNGHKVYKQFDNQGFIHGQSLNHAVTAAVLRAGYNSIKDKGDNNNALAINLSSSRVRKALHLLEGVSNGQEVGALLGYMFERALHEKYSDDADKPLEMDVFIYRLRREFPTYSDSQVDPADQKQSESVKASNVVDGIALIDHFESMITDKPWYDPDKTLVDNIINLGVSPIQFRGYPWGLTGKIPNPSNPGTGSTSALERKKLRAIIHEIDNMADALDALGDLVTAEGVYQLVRGNHVRASAVLNAMSEGKVPLDPEIIRSMRQGSMVTHRAILQIPFADAATSSWTGVDESPRSIMEPSINNWLASQIGDPTRVTWTLSHGDSTTFMSLVDLNLQPVDLVLLITTGGDESQGELQARCLNHLHSLSPDSEGDIVIKYNEAAGPSDLSFGEMVSLFQHLGKVVGAARCADARDYRIPEEEANFGPAAPGIDTDQLMARMRRAFQDYKSLYDSLAPFESSKTTYSDSEKSLAESALRALSLWGFNGFYPEASEREITAQVQRIVSAKSKMEENIAFAEANFDSLELEVDHGKWLSFLTEFSTKFFGSGFKVLPKVVVSNQTAIQGQLDMSWDQSPLRNHEPSHLMDWWSGISLVRNRLSNLETVSFLSEILGGESLNFKPAQLPLDMDNLPPLGNRDYWLGSTYPSDFDPEGDRLSLLIFERQNILAEGCGLILDEWMEIIPEKKQTTGIAFHFNQPDARAPQNLLLAVPPEKRGTWDFEELGLCVEEAFNLVRLRSLEPDQVEESMFAQILPATATLAFGDAEFAMRLAEDIPDDQETETPSGEENKLGYFIDYTHVNTGHETEK